MLKVGTKVHISSLGKLKYSNSRSNPHRLKGEVVRVGMGRYSVKWSNGRQNIYGDGDLEVNSMRGVAQFLRRIEGKDAEEPTSEVEEPTDVKIKFTPFVTW